MAYLLRFLLVLMLLGTVLTILLAMQILTLPLGHIQVAIPTFIYTIFAQAFVMFYFIGVSKMVTNVAIILNSKVNLQELFDEPPADLSPYLQKVNKFLQDSNLCKRQTIPWTMLMLVLGMAAFLLGGAHDTGLVSRPIHSGLVYGFFAAMLIGFVRQWHYLGKSHQLLRNIKGLFSIPDGSM